MKTSLVQIVVLSVIALQSSHVLSLSFDGSRGELSNLAILGPGLLLLSSFQGAFGEKSKRSKKKQDPEEVKEEDDKAQETSKTVANHIIEELKEKAKKVQAQNLENKTPQNDISKRKVSPQNDVEMDPMKCFPKALCGVSSEVAQISKKQKNGLITDYLLLMRAIARNPNVVDEAARPLRNKKKTGSSYDDEPQDDTEQNDEGSSEEEDEEEEDDEEDSGEGEEEDDDVQDDADSYRGKKTSQKPKEPLTADDKAHEEYLREKLEMDQLYKETLDKETWNDDNWWGAYGDDSPVVNKNKRRPPNYRTDIPDGGTSGNAGGASSFLSNLFSFGSSSSSPGNWGSGSSFGGMARDFPSSEVVPGIGMDETKEILETAIEIGKGFDKPSQCNEIFNGCKYDYTDLLYMIDEMRHSLREKASNGKRKGNKKAKTAVEVNHHQQSSSSAESSTGSKTKSRYRVTPKGSRKKNKQIKKKRPNKSDTDRVVIPNSHEKLTKLPPRPHHHQNHHNHNHHSGEESAGPPGSSPGFSLTNMFSSWLG